jgi:hypothetical protein
VTEEDGSIHSVTRFDQTPCMSSMADNPWAPSNGDGLCSIENIKLSEHTDRRLPYNPTFNGLDNSTNRNEYKYKGLTSKTLIKSAPINPVDAKIAELNKQIQHSNDQLSAEVIALKLQVQQLIGLLQQ